MNVSYVELAPQHAHHSGGNLINLLVPQAFYRLIDF